MLPVCRQDASEVAEQLALDANLLLEACKRLEVLPTHALSEALDTMDKVAKHLRDATAVVLQVITNAQSEPVDDDEA